MWGVGVAHRGAVVTGERARQNKELYHSSTSGLQLVDGSY